MMGIGGGAPVICVLAGLGFCVGQVADRRRIMNRKRPLKAGDIYPAHILRDEYGMNAANRPEIVVNQAEVPEGLRFLIPAVERWAIPCDVTRGDYFDQQPEVDVAKFWYDVRPHVDAVNQWLDTQPDDVGKWPEAAVHFMYLLKAHSEAYQPTEEEKRQCEERRAAWEHERSLKEATARGLAAFKNKDFAAVIDALAPFEGELDKITAAKLGYARKKMES